MGKKRVLICDDQDRFIEQFRENHSDYFDIISVHDVRQVIDELHGMKVLPDVLLLDLYHPIHEDADFEARRLKAEEELSKLNEQIDRTKKAVSLRDMAAFRTGNLGRYSKRVFSSKATCCYLFTAWIVST